MNRSFLLSLSLTICLFVISLVGYGKPVPLIDSIELVFKDTIHVRGKIVDERGKPLRAIGVSTGGYYRGLVSTSTNADGNFLLKNVQPNDTLFFIRGNRFAKIYPEGSRILNVVLREELLNLSEATVRAKRHVPKGLKNSTEKFENFAGFPNYGYEPEYPGGIDKFHKNLNAKVAYPDKARMANIEGMVEIEFTLDSLGQTTNFRTIHGLGYGCEEAVIEILKEAKWKLGIRNGYPYARTMSLKVLFKLEDL